MAQPASIRNHYGMLHSWINRCRHRLSSSKQLAETTEDTAEFICYVKTGDSHDFFVWMNKKEKRISESKFAILEAASPLPGAGVF